MTEPHGDIDFFISYRGKNASWAKWIKWVLRGAGYTTRSMDEFPKGTEFTDQMREACEHCHRLIPLYSADYWKSGACTGEFDTYWNQHFGNKQARFLIPLEIESCTVPDAHRQLLFESLHGCTSADAHALILNAISGITPTGTPATDVEPPFPGKASALSVPSDWPDSAPTLRWPLANHDDAREAFATLVTKSTPYRLLAIEGASETGKTHLTRQFFNNAQRRVPGCVCGRFDFKGTGDLQPSLAEFAEHLQVPVPAASSGLSAQLSAVLASLAQRQQPALLIFDAYEYAGEADRWVRERLLSNLHRHAWLRVVIAGQRVPECHGHAWDEDSKIVPVKPPDPEHWHAWGKENNRDLPISFAHQAHAACRGKASTLASLFGPQKN